VARSRPAWNCLTARQRCDSCASAASWPRKAVAAASASASLFCRSVLAPPNIAVEPAVSRCDTVRSTRRKSRAGSRSSAYALYSFCGSA